MIISISALLQRAVKFVRNNKLFITVNVLILGLGQETKAAAQSDICPVDISNYNEGAMSLIDFTEYSSINPFHSHTVVNQQLQLSESALIAREIEELCSSNSFVTLNKKNSMAYLPYRDNFAPKSCIVKVEEGSEDQCPVDVREHNNYMNSENIKQLKRQFDEEKPLVDDVTKLKIGSVFDSGLKLLEIFTLNPKLRERFIAYLENVALMYSMKFTSDYMIEKVNIGQNCGYLASYSAYKILQLSHAHQKIIYLRYLGVATNGNAMHEFIIVDSHEISSLIKDNAPKVFHYFRGLKKGYYCDRWNQGFFRSTKLKMDDLYRFPWDAITINRVYSLDFNLKGMPRQVHQFFDQHLNALGLSNLHGKEKFDLESGLQDLLDQTVQHQRKSSL